MICNKHNEKKVTYRNGKKVCKSCNKEQQAKWWRKNKETQKQRVKDNRKRLQDITIEHRINNPCVICGETSFLVLEFDHLHSKEKNIAELCRKGISGSKIKEEIDKCRVLCSNCHQIKTHIENNSYVLQTALEKGLYIERIERIKHLIREDVQKIREFEKRQRE